MKMYNVISDRMKRFNLGCDINDLIHYCQCGDITTKFISVDSMNKSVHRKEMVSNLIISFCVG